MALLSTPSTSLRSPFLSSHLSLRPFELSGLSPLPFRRSSPLSSDRLFNGDFPLLLLLLFRLGAISLEEELLLGDSEEGFSFWV